MAAGLLLVSPVSDGVGDAPPFQVVQCEALIGRYDLILQGQGDETLPCSVQAGFTKWSTVTGHNDVPA